MTLDDVKRVFGSCYNFANKTGWAHTNYYNWKKKGYIPIETQFDIERMTLGKLKADINHGRMKNDTRTASGV